MRRHSFAAAPYLALMVCAALWLVGSAVSAQTQKGVPNALQGFSENRGKPVQIEAASLEVRDRDKLATFGGGVSVTQGDTNMKAKTLLVYYDQEAGPGGMNAAPAGSEGAQSIKRLEAKGGVRVTQKDQVATGDEGVFDMRANTVMLIGNVVVSKGQNEVKGGRLVVDMNTGVSRVEGGGASGRISVQGNTGPTPKAGTR
jgi:lipopolysaccharide export system protein LptA